MYAISLKYIINPLILVLSITLALAFLTLVERKVIGSMQLRKGPNIAHSYGLFQPIADGLKLFTKEPVRPLTTSPLLFIFAPFLAFTLALMLWTLMPMPFPLVDLTLGLLFLLALSSLAVYSILGAGWASNSMYALIGAMRAVAQTISYEVSLGLILLSTVIFSGSFTIQAFDTTQESIWLLLPAWPLAFMWYISTLAETNRAPFDLTEGESELVSGFNIEYAAGHFALFFLAEYANILLMNALSAVLFLGTTTLHNFPEISTVILMIKTTFLSIIFLWIRASYPRFRYDQLMHLIWKSFLPTALAFLALHTALPTAFLGLPPQL
uniref:NADH dehydrogenase subunit 1 n=1 Tax=Millerichthys robustus TaxID=2588674 RepID=UPI00315D2F1E